MLVSLLGLVLLAGPVEQLEFRFIGNMAFHVTDGRTTLLTDFPYESGYSGYMSWRTADVPPLEDGLSLITHRHADHFEPELFRSMGLRIVGPTELTQALPADRVVPLSSRVAYRDIAIEPIATPHGKLEHYSYLVTWHGVRMYFTGDTEETSALVAARDLDVAFVSPWLIAALAERGERVDTRRLVCYHHTAGESVPAFQDRLVPKQGETFRMPFRVESTPRPDF
jgi:L-ascorbate metabolism protein UlaG (beta-lactamase superfamily)